MINLFLAFDDDDATMGGFNRGCMQDYRDYFDRMNDSVSTKYITTRTLNPVNLEVSIDSLDKAFIFGAYSHGQHDRLLAKNEPYIGEENADKYRNSLFYTVSCHTASTLADHLINNGCLCYFGYKSEFNYWDGYIEFSACANHGLFKFFEGENTESVYELMIGKYNDTIDALIDQEESFFQAALLRHNRDALVRKGEVITIEDF